MKYEWKKWKKKLSLFLVRFILSVELINLTCLLLWFYSIRLFRLYLLGCHICEIFKNCVKIAIQTPIYHSHIDSVNNKLMLLKFIVHIILTDCLISTPKIFLLKENKLIQNFYNPNNFFLKPDNTEQAIKEDSAMVLLSTNVNNLIPLTMDSQCKLFSMIRYNVSMKLSQRTPNPLTYRKDKK